MGRTRTLKRSNLRATNTREVRGTTRIVIVSSKKGRQIEGTRSRSLTLADTTPSEVYNQIRRRLLGEK